MTITLDQIDSTCREIHSKIPEASMVHVSRCLIDGDLSWDASVLVPRRTKNFRVMKGYGETLRVHADTLEGLIEKAVQSYRFHVTGTL